MWNSINSNIRNVFFADIPNNAEAEYLKDCALKNNYRFTILPVFNIITQIFCYFIYLFIYPSGLPDQLVPNLTPFTIFSISYIAGNVFFCAVFSRMHKRRELRGVSHKSYRLLLAFLTFYVLFESMEALLEVSFSGSIFRPLAAFFVTAFLPLLPRKEKFFFLIFFVVLIEAGFIYLAGRSDFQDRYFQEFIFFFFLVCLAISSLSYNSSVKAFVMNHDLILQNEKLKKAIEQLEYLAVIDPLTKISNRRAFEQFVSFAWRSAFEDGKFVSILMIDIDDFKAFNDTYGHPKGDECLQAVSSCISGFFRRKTDMVARYGGEEFIVLSVQNELKNVRAYADKMRSAVQELKIKNENGSTGGFITVSVGVASIIPSDQMQSETLVQCADEALYAAKNRGKNQVFCAP